MSFFALMFLFFVLMRLGRFHRMRRWHRGYVYGWPPHRQLYHLRHAGEAPRQAPVVPTENAYERLKRRYVKGELSDDQYEAELDALLKTPEGRSQV